MDSPSHPFAQFSKFVNIHSFIHPSIYRTRPLIFLSFLSTVSTSQGPSSASPQQPAPEFTQYYGILVKIPRGLNVAPPFVPPFLMRDAPERTIPRESKDASAVPSVLSSWDADSRLSFFLVEKAIWDDRDLTLRRKLTTGTYWNMSAQGRGNLRREMDRAEVGQISGIEVIGLGDGEYDALKKCRQCKCASNQGTKLPCPVGDG